MSQRPRRILRFLAALLALSAASARAEDSAESAELGYRIERDHVYARPGGYRLRADMFVPHGSGPHPGLMLIHGGGWMGGSKVQMNWHATRLASLGYVVMSINYRLAPQYKFPAQIEDCRAALHWLCDHAEKFQLDSQRLGAVGYSAGGHLACLLNVTSPVDAPRRLRAVAAGGAPCNFMVMPPDSLYLSYWLDGTRVQRPQNYFAASPVNYVSADDAPTFFFHGARDRLVPPFSFQSLKDRLESSGVEVDMYLCSKKGHVHTFLDQTAFKNYAAFLDRHLKRAAGREER